MADTLCGPLAIFLDYTFIHLNIKAFWCIVLYSIYEVNIFTTAKVYTLVHLHLPCLRHVVLVVCPFINAIFPACLCVYLSVCL